MTLKCQEFTRSNVWSSVPRSRAGKGKRQRMAPMFQPAQFNTLTLRCVTHQGREMSIEITTTYLNNLFRLIACWNDSISDPLGYINWVMKMILYVSFHPFNMAAGKIRFSLWLVWHFFWGSSDLEGNSNGSAMFWCEGYDKSGEVEKHKGGTRCLFWGVRKESYRMHCLRNSTERQCASWWGTSLAVRPWTSYLPLWASVSLSAKWRRCANPPRKPGIKSSVTQTLGIL